DGRGGRHGHLLPLAAARGLPVFSADVSWMSLARHAERVYVATSHAGLEALIAGAQVTCFGLPAYAGWGLTDDRVACPRRVARPSLDALVAAVYLRYTRYLSPLDDQPCSALDVAELLAARRRRDCETAGHIHVLGVNRLKRVQVRPFVEGRRSTVTWSMDTDRALDHQRRHGGPVVVWASRDSEDLATRCAAQGAALVRMEDGFLRSVGLGANLELPASLVLDPDGIYYDPSRPSRLERLLQSATFEEALLQRAAALRTEIGRARVSKYNVGAGGLADGWARAEGRTRVLVPAQVANDASVVRGGGRIRDNLALLEASRKARPDAFIVFKPHPDVEAGLRPGALSDQQVLRFADAIAPRASIAALLDDVDEVHTLTSLAGFEALLRGRRVATYGLPFYAGWGLTEDREICPRRIRRLTLDELIAGTLILYPRYTDRVSGWPCQPEQVVRRLSEGRTRSNNVDLLERRRGRAVLRQLLE
ncbi:MAG: hypothetical protein JO157_03265, partial [Acetobacteraceae bacterium]|nr:hypothetical protein [Acetobacteraceae bacterium]